MANVTRIENLSDADQELAPGTGFIPAKGFRDYPSDEYSEQHEKFAKARLEANPPILKVGEASGDAEGGGAPAGQQTLPEGVPQPATSTTQAQKQTEQNATDARKQEEQRREEERRRQAELEQQASRSINTATSTSTSDDTSRKRR